MCSLYNWYENRFPNDFAQLIKIKHYNFTEISFLLSKVWLKLDDGEKLLMCAVYYDDFNLAKQLLNEKELFKVNPFCGKRYFTQTPCKTYISSSGSMSSAYDTDDSKDVFNNDTASTVSNAASAAATQQRQQFKCWCQSNRNLLSLSSIRQTRPSVYIENDLFDAENNQTYYFNQLVCDFYMQTPFYFAVKFNKLKMCQFFIENLSTIYLSTLNRKLTRRQQLQQQNIHHKNCNHSASNKNTSLKRASTNNNSNTIYLNSMLNDSELIKLLVLALSNHNYEIAKLLLSNVYNPKQILNFNNLSESFIYNKEFCLYLVRNKIVQPHVMLRESTNRHACATTTLVIGYIEGLNEFKYSPFLLFDTYKIVLNNSINIYDLSIFRFVLPKINKILVSNNHDDFSQIIELSIQSILNKNTNSPILKRLRSFSYESNIIDAESTMSLATSKGFDWNGYFSQAKSDSSNDFTPDSTSLSYLNRLKLVSYLFSTNAVSGGNLNAVCTKSKIELIESEFRKLWLSCEYTMKKKLANYERMFAADETHKTDTAASFTSGYNSGRKRIHLGGYLVINDNEPFMISSFMELAKNKYNLTNGDLISAAKNCISELTLYYLMGSVDFSQNVELLRAQDDVYGNFMEIIFCRLVRCNNLEQELRLRRLFIELIVLKNAKMTCSANLINLFVSNSQHVKQKLLDIYFPCLFYLSNSFNLFLTRQDEFKFRALVNWFVRYCLFGEHLDLMPSFGSSSILVSSLTQKQIDLIIFEFYANKSIKKKFSFNFDLSLKELSRNSFMKVYLNFSQTYADILNAISDPVRQFIFYFNEIRSLFLSTNQTLSTLSASSTFLPSLKREVSYNSNNI